MPVVSSPTAFTSVELTTASSSLTPLKAVSLEDTAAPPADIVAIMPAFSLDNLTQLHSTLKQILGEDPPGPVPFVTSLGDAEVKDEPLELTPSQALAFHPPNFIVPPGEEDHEPMEPANPSLEELEHFAKRFRKERIELGFTQGDVGLALGKLYGSDFSQTTISRFEALNLSFKNMCMLFPMLKGWLEKGSQTDVSLLLPETDKFTPKSKRRKKRTVLDSNTRDILEEFFQTEPRPSGLAVSAIADELHTGNDFIRVWFANRRQKEKRSLSDSMSSVLSESHDISSRQPTPPPFKIQKVEPQEFEEDRRSPVLVTGNDVSIEQLLAI